jgi:hypothetical protein
MTTGGVLSGKSTPSKLSTQPKEQHPVAVQRAAQRTGKSSMASHINETIYLEDLEELGISE